MNVKRMAGRVLDIVDPNNRVRDFRNQYFRDNWLTKVNNVVHVGANIGQEAHDYASHDLGVLWIEPIPAVFQNLQQNILPFKNQRAYQALVTDKAGESVTLNVSSNDGLSSSIFEWGIHKEMWPDIDYTDRITLSTQTLDDILRADPVKYDGLVMDTQGAELLVLKGALQSLKTFQYIRCESANFEIYKGATTDDEIVGFLTARGFKLKRRDVFARAPRGESAPT